jgi:quercetin dioxygenase-like cupin family protein
MALPHADPGCPIDLHAPADTPAASRSQALFKSRDLEVIRLVLARGDGLPLHRVRGEVVVHCLHGVLQVEAGDTDATLQAGQLLFLGGGTPHTVRARVDATTVLLTIAIGRPGADRAISAPGVRASAKPSSAASSDGSRLR